MFNRKTRRNLELTACVFITLACLVPFVGFAVVLGFGLVVSSMSFVVASLGGMAVMSCVAFFFYSLS